MALMFEGTKALLTWMHACAKALLPLWALIAACVCGVPMPHPLRGRSLRCPTPLTLSFTGETRRALVTRSEASLLPHALLLSSRSVAFHPSGLHVLVGTDANLQLLNVLNKGVHLWKDINIKVCVACPCTVSPCS